MAIDNDKAAADARRKATLFDAALTLLLERAGGRLAFTEAEYQEVVARYGGSKTMAIHYEVVRAEGQPDRVELTLIRKAPENAELPV